MSGGSGHEHDYVNHQSNADRFIICVINQIQNFRHHLRHRRSGDLHGLPFFNWPLFTFHPATNRIALGWEAARSGEGPNMTWYGWTATTLLAGSVVSFLATLLPETVTRKIPLILVWLIPFLAIPYLAWDLRQWWFHP